MNVKADIPAITVPDTPEVRDALAQFEAMERARGAQELVALPSLGTLCQTYDSIKPYVPVLLPVIKAIPGIGSKAATVLQTAASIADLACPVQARQAHAALFAQDPHLATTTHAMVLRTLELAGVAQNEDTKYDSAKISNGYGTLNKAGVSVQRGVTARLHVEFIIETVTRNSFKSWLDSQKHSYSKEDWHTLEENYAAGGFLGGVLTGAFGLLFGAGTYNHYKNQHDKTVEADDSEKKGFLKSLSQVQRSKVKLVGDITATGTSFIPVEGFVFVETTSIEFQNGETLTVVNTSNPVVADQSGSTSGLDTSGGQQLSVVPIK